LEEKESLTKDSNMSKGGGKTVQTSQSTAPWTAQQPYLQDLFGRGQQQSYQPRVAPMSGYTQQAISGRAAEGSDPNSLTNQAQGLYGSTINGDYLNSNPHLDATVQRALGQTRTAVNAGFQGDNYGSSAHQEWLGNKLADTALPYYMNNYENERGRQMQAAAGAPLMAEAGLSQTQRAGEMQDLYSQRQTDAPWDALARYQALIQGGYGGNSTGTQPYSDGNPLANMAGLGLMAYGAFK
jgi:hypothetical protein